MDPLDPGAEVYMSRCLDIAREAMDNGDPPVGSVLVYEGRIIGEGQESGRSTDDITNHAEIEAVRDAINKGHKHLLSKSKMYTTHEPCIMCSYLIRHHQIPEIVCGCKVPDVGGASSPHKVLTSSAIPKWGDAPSVRFGLMEEACTELMRQFAARSSSR